MISQWAKACWIIPSCGLELKLKDELKPTSVDARHTNCCVKYSSKLPGGSLSDMIFFAMNHGGVGVAQDMAQFGEAGIHCALFEAHSRGSVRLASPSPNDQPIVDLNMLDDPRDLARLRDGARRLMAIGVHPAATSRCREISLGNTGRPIADLAEKSDDDVDEWILTDCFRCPTWCRQLPDGAYGFRTMAQALSILIVVFAA